MFSPVEYSMMYPSFFIDLGCNLIGVWQSLHSTYTITVVSFYSFYAVVFFIKAISQQFTLVTYPTFYWAMYLPLFLHSD